MPVSELAFWTPKILDDLQVACADGDTADRVVSVIQPAIEELIRQNSGFQLSRAILEKLVENFPGGIVSIMDEELRHIFIGGETMGRMGFVAAEMLGKRPTEALPGEKSESLERAIRRAMQGESVRSLEADGAMSTLTTCTPIYDGDTCIGTIVVGQDVTDLAAIQEEKFAQERARARLQEEIRASRERATLIENLLHEIRNPLASLSSSTEILQQYGTRINEEKRDEHLARIYESVRLMAGTLAHLAQIDG